MKKILFWTLAVVITLTSVIYQRKTGPTYPKNTEINIDGNFYEFKLPRSGNSDEDSKIEIPLNNNSITGILKYKRFPINEEFKEINLIPINGTLTAFLPKQPPAGKLEYFLSFYEENNQELINTEHIVIRFKGHVPTWAIIPHVFFIFIAMLLSNVAGIFAIAKSDRHVLYGNLTLLTLIIGGFIFGPIMQYFAFGQAWTGIPFGWDLTDNKTLLAALFWIVAVLGNRKSPKYRYSIIASIVLLLVYLIPHSLFGSELDYSSGEVVTGFCFYFSTKEQVFLQPYV